MSKEEDYLRERYPLCFNDAYQPLMIGIDKEIFKTEHPLNKSKIRRGISAYARSEQYISNLQEGLPRINLLGQPITTVTQKEVTGLNLLKKKADKVGGFQNLLKQQAKQKKKRYRARKSAERRADREALAVLNKQFAEENRLIKAKRRVAEQTKLKNTTKKPATKKPEPVIVEKKERIKRPNVKKIRDKLLTEKPILLGGGKKATIVVKKR